MIVTLEKGTINEFVAKLFYNKFVKANKPCHIFVTGKSGEGKSWLSLKLAEIICSELELKVKPEHVLNLHAIYDFEDFTKVCKHVFESKCEIPLIMMFEGSVLSHARQFMSKQNIVIGRIMSLSRTVKPVIFIINSQHWRDLDVWLRRRVDFYITVNRYVLSTGQSIKPIAKIYHVSHTIDRLILTPVYAKIGNALNRVHALSLGKPNDVLIKEFERIEKSKKKELIELSLDIEQ
jgi:hypothetical protein